MSDENLINVEDDTPDTSPAPGEPGPGAVAASPPEPAVLTDADVELDLNAIDVKDEGRVRGLIGELSRKRAENRTLKQQAERATQLEQELAQSRPYVDFLKNNQHLLQPRQDEPTPAEPTADPDAVEAARLMDFYKADGSPDVDRGARWLALQDRRSGRVAQQAVQPWAQHTTTQQVEANRATYTALAQQFKIQPQIAREIWDATAREPNGLQTLANPASVQALFLLANGASALAAQRQPAPPAREPNVTESVVSRNAPAPVRLSQIEERVLANRGMKPTEYAEHTKNFKPGVSNVLED